MQSNTKSFRHIAILYGTIVFLANMLAVLVTSILQTPVLDEQNVNIWTHFLHDSPVIALVSNSICFVVPTIICIVYSHFIKNTFKSELANIPAVYAFSSFISWVLNFFIEIPVALYARAKVGISVSTILATSALFTPLAACSAFVTCYLLLESLNRAYILPRFFPGGHIPKTATRLKPSFRWLFLFCFFVTSLFPIVYLIFALISIQANNGLPVQKDSIILATIMLLVALGITLILVRIIVHPLKTLTAALARIKDGDYESQVRIITGDELGTLADGFNDMATSLKEKEIMRDTFGKVVDPGVRDYLLQHPATLSGETREVTVLFCDIRGFTSLSEKMAASDVVSLLNRYFTALGNCITQNGGIINKYIGDAIMAIFGAPVHTRTHAQDACMAAAHMRKALVRLNADFGNDGLPSLRFGIGIHTGPVFAGTIGAQSRMEYTIIGDTVNTASRMEALCKTYQTDLLISETTYEKLHTLQDSFHFVDCSYIRGKEEKIKLYTA